MGLAKLAQEDPSFGFSRDEETGQTVIEGAPCDTPGGGGGPAAAAGGCTSTRALLISRRLGLFENSASVHTLKRPHPAIPAPPPPITSKPSNI